MRTFGMVLAVCALGLLDAAPADAQARRGQQAPAFCRNGQGHPVHGRHWCIDRGFGLGGVVWRQQRWDDAVLRTPRRGSRADRAALGDLLGAVIIGRLEGHSRRIGLNDALTGRWLATDRGGTILEIRSGRAPIAELVDLDGNGRFDLVLLNTGIR
jgi:hypothetical protein